MDVKKYVKRPVQVEAVQVTEDNLEQVAQWCGGVAAGELRKSGLVRWVVTDGGSADVGDWVAKDVLGNAYAIRGEVFEQTYDEHD